MNTKYKLAILGNKNIEKYSLSPLIHENFLNSESLKGEYKAIPTSPENFNETLISLKNLGYRGVNLTMPLKILALNFLNELDETARNIGAVNTILFENDKMIGYNTDAYGFIENLNTKIKNWKENNNKVLVIGAGGASHAIVYSLKSSGMNNLLIANRTREKALKLADKFAFQVINFKDIQKNLKNINLLVNTTSIGMKNNDNFNLELKDLQSNSIVYDIVYTPLLTPLLSSAKELNFKIVDGLGMLLFQAAKAFEIWTGIYPTISNSLLNKCFEKLK